MVKYQCPVSGQVRFAADMQEAITASCITDELSYGGHGYAVVSEKDCTEGEPCPVCSLVGAYCGGSRHSSCGIFKDGFPSF